MKPVFRLLQANKDCGWTFQPDLPDLATTSSEFEESIALKQDKCGHKSLLMGGWVQCHTADEHIYHEMLVHPALATYSVLNGAPPRRVFLGGSGEGAGAREILRWRSVENITMVDIDYEVTRFTSEHLPHLSNNSFNDPRMTLVTGDAVKFLKKLPAEERFDVLILDFPDPFESEELEALYSQNFYQIARSAMREGAVLATQSGPCSDVNARGGKKLSCDVLEDLIMDNVAKVFSDVDVLQHPMATWKADEDSLSEWSTITLATGGAGPAAPRQKEMEGAFGIGSTMVIKAAEDVDRWLTQEVGTGVLRFYSGVVHRMAWEKPLKLLARLVDERNIKSKLAPQKAPEKDGMQGPRVFPTGRGSTEPEVFFA